MSVDGTIPLAELASDRNAGGLPEADGVDILIHVGLHKTATTWLQNEVFGHSAEIVYQQDFGPTHRAFLLPRADEFSLGVVRKEFGALLERARREAKPLVISDEALGGVAFHQKYFREIAALRLRAAFPAARILISVREQNALLISLYGEYLRYGYCSTLDRFLARQSGRRNVEPVLDYAFYEYDRTLAFYQGLFGPDRAIAVPMEWSVARPAEFMARLGAVLGCSLTLPPQTQSTRKVRPAYSGWARSVQRFLNGFESQDSRSLLNRGRWSSNSIAFQIDRRTPGWARKRSSEQQRQTVERLVGDYFAPSNARFAKRSGFDLAALGYKVARAGTDSRPFQGSTGQ